MSSELVCTFYSRNQIDILNVAKQSSSKLTSSLVLHNIFPQISMLQGAKTKKIRNTQTVIKSRSKAIDNLRNVWNAISAGVEEERKNNLPPDDNDDTIT